MRLPLSLILCTLALPASATERRTELALEGFGGLINTPTAWTVESGWAQFLATQQVDPQYRLDGPTSTFILAAGFLPFVEAAARVTEVAARDVLLANGARGFKIRDLSLNLKIQVPLQLVWPKLPVALALGTQDEGGAAPHFRSRYVVASADLWKLRLSAGYGTGPDRMDGVFGGVSFAPVSFAEFLAEYDASEFHAGLRLGHEARIGGVPLRVSGLFKTSLNHQPGRLDVGLSLSVPLALSDESSVEATQVVSAVALPAVGPVEDLTADPLVRLSDALVEIGFENVRAGREGERTVVVEYENNVFNHSQADGLAVVLARLAHHAPKTAETFAVVIRRHQIALVELSGELKALRAFLAAAPDGERELEKTLEFRWSPGPRAAVTYVNSRPRNASALHGQLILGPGLRTFVATEISNLEVVVSARPEASLQLWPGASLYGRWDIPFAWTSALADGGPLRAYRGGPRLDHGLLQQAVALPFGALGALSAGIYRIDSLAALGEVLVPIASGEHLLGLQAGLGRTVGGETRRSVVASYRAFLSPLELAATLRVGQFYGGDRGLTFELTRYFGDTEVGAFYTRTDKAILGVLISLPLTPRRDLRPGHVQVMGSPRWGQQVQTVVQEAANNLTSGLGQLPAPPRSMEGFFLDKGRLNRGALLAGLRRARFNLPALLDAPLDSLANGVVSEPPNFPISNGPKSL